MLKRVAVSLIAVAGLVLVSVVVSAQRADDSVRAAMAKLRDPNPDVRAQAVDEVSRANNRAAAIAVLGAVAAENDGPAGFRMADSISNFNAPEAMETIEKTVLAWNTADKLFGAYWVYCGLARVNEEKQNAVLRKAITEAKRTDLYNRAAAIEAMSWARRTDMLDLLLGVIDTYDPTWETRHPILTTTCLYAAPRMCDRRADAEARKRTVLSLANVLEKTTDDRIQYFTAKALAEITGEDTYIDPAFWRFWVQLGGERAKQQHEGPTVAGRDVPRFFKSAAVGKRVVFVIDISGSMQHPVNLPAEMRRPPEPKKEERGPVTGRGGSEGKDKPAEIPAPDYSKVRSKLDLAKVELIHTLRHLPEDYKFNIVIYHTSHDLIDTGVRNLIPATKANKDKFIKRVEQLNWAQLTNIHGALIRSFCINEKSMIDQRKLDPAWDAECLYSGATTIFFLTDGAPTISDDTTNHGEMSRVQGTRANGRFVQPQNIVDDIRRVNTFRKTVINTVGIGPHYGALMRALAEMTGGDYVDRSGMSDRGD